MIDIGPSMLLWSFGISFGLVGVGVWIFRRYARQLGFVDIPNERSVHSVPLPSAGGMVFVLASPLVALFIAASNSIQLSRGEWALLASAWVLAIVSLIDDRQRIPARVRLIVQFWAAAGLIVYGGYLQYFSVGDFGGFNVGWLGIPITFIWLVGVANAYNFMDGLDGLASGQAVIASLAAVWLATTIGWAWQAVFAAALAGGVLGFFLHNAPPARVFMGDVGSIWLGFTFAGLAVLGATKTPEGLPFGFWVILLGIFLLDTSLTLVRRIMNGEPVLQAHRTHYYQRLLRVGWTHRRVTLLYLLLATGLAIVAAIHFGIVRLSLSVLVLVGLATFASTFALVHYVETRKSQLEAVRGKALKPVAAGGLLQPITVFIKRSGMQLLLDSLIVVASYGVAFILRFAWNTLDVHLFYAGLRDGIMAIIFVHLTVNGALGIYAYRWQVNTINRIALITMAPLLSSLALAGGEILLGPVRSIPLSVIGLGASFAAAGFIYSRLLIGAFVQRARPN